MRCSPVAFARTTIACRCSSANPTASRCWMPSSAETRGSSSAPTARRMDARPRKQACGCAGIYSAHAALELYAQVLEDAGALHRLEAFASEFGPQFYGLPLNEGSITLRRESWSVPEAYPFGGDVVVPMRAGETLRWRVATREPGHRTDSASLPRLPAHSHGCRDRGLSLPDRRPAGNGGRHHPGRRHRPRAVAERRTPGMCSPSRARGSTPPRLKSMASIPGIPCARRFPNRWPCRPVPRGTHGHSLPWLPARRFSWVTTLRSTSGS